MVLYTCVPPTYTLGVCCCHKLHLYTLCAHQHRFIVSTLCTCLLKYTEKWVTNQKYINTDFYIYLYSVLYFFIWSQVTVSCTVISSWRSPFYISSGRSASKKLSQLLSKNVLISSTFLKDNCTRYRILNCQFLWGFF